MEDVILLTMRRMRSPLILMILVYSASVFGLVMIPGQDPQGRPIDVGYLDAAYYVAIMATTIGFGEIPYAFTGAQRLYAFLIILPNVGVWLYSFGTILSLILDPQFRAVLRQSRFRRLVRGTAEPFYIVCGFGSTGSMIVTALVRRGYGAVVLEREEDIIHRMELQPEISRVPALSGDVTDRGLLESAGLHHPQCCGIIAITNEDHANLTIAITSKLLRPELSVIARSENQRVTANMDSFGTDHVIEPYAIFAERFYLALSSPIKYLVQDWLISVPGSELRERMELPSGRWIVCGLGRFGSRLAERLEQAGLPYTVVDVHPDRVANQPGSVLGRGTEAATLLEAGVEDAVGIIAGTGDDVDNLSIVMTALELNPKLFTVARQERQQNDELFERSHAQLVARRSLIVARRALYIATTPLMQTFLHYLASEDEDFAHHVASRLKSVLGGQAPAIWTETLEGSLRSGLDEAREYGTEVRLEHITQHSRTQVAEDLPCLCLLLERGASRIFLPPPGQELHAGDRLLFAGRNLARDEILWTLTEPYALIANATGRHIPRSAVWRWIERHRANP
ncbi:potassium channel family protein [Elongatibacter sediminis]|uniref:NAD-binding protein n=1 Tax=Elongatibacter sediminis TaxID=3119006 RepID=A0AAW9RFJ2_9GAMM